LLIERITLMDSEVQKDFTMHESLPDGALPSVGSCLHMVTTRRTEER